jgi:hypothetical protein
MNIDKMLSNIEETASNISNSIFTEENKGLVFVGGIAFFVIISMLLEVRASFSTAILILWVLSCYYCFNYKPYTIRRDDYKWK